MASLSCGFVHPRWRTMSTWTAGVCCEEIRPPICSSRHHLTLASGFGGHSVKTTFQPRRLEVAGKETKRTTTRTTTLLHLASPPALCFLAGEVTAAAAESRQEEERPALGFMADSRADVSGRREENESRALDNAAGSFELESLLHGHIGRFAFLAILLLGVGLGYLTNVGDAEAATSHVTTSHGALDVDMRALALGPEGPLLEEFWDNMRRYGLYFLTVVTGGVYQLVKPAIDALRNPATAVLIVVIVTGSIYLVSLTVSAMLGINEFQYDYAI